jgi:hypothetical protein
MSDRDEQLPSEEAELPMGDDPVAWTFRKRVLVVEEAHTAWILGQPVDVEALIEAFYELLGDYRELETWCAIVEMKADRLEADPGTN